jgi:carbamoyl-phosphate synthase small subunit
MELGFGALVMRDGTVFLGGGFGERCARPGELVFNTAMQGYVESLTDPSYAGQILVSTYPLIGNYGVNKAWAESEKVHVEGYVVRELCSAPFHRDSEMPLDGFLRDGKVPGVCGIDTRQIVRKVRNEGVMPAVICSSDSQIDISSLLENLDFDYSGIDFVPRVTCKQVSWHGEGKKKVGLIDYGAKGNILRELVARKLRVALIPAHATLKEIEALELDGIMLSNGPGDPKVLVHAHEVIRGLKDYPMFGICLGNQLVAHAFGGDTYKLKFGHRGVNHPVVEEKTGRVWITSQNHGFAVGKVPEGFTVSHRSANDRSVEGLVRGDGRIFTVQFHPEACPGPHDARELFDKFVGML